MTSVGGAFGEDAVQQLGDLLGVLAAEGLVPVDEALVDEVDGDLDHGGAGCACRCGSARPRACRAGR